MVDGLSGFGDFLEELDEAGLRRALPSVLGMLDAMRSVPLASIVGAGSWRGEGVAERSSWRAHLLGVATDHPDRRTYGWREQLATKPDAEAAFNDACVRLASLVDVCPEIRHVVHSDLLHRNVLVGDDRVAAVFDWQCALYGDFLYDDKRLDVPDFDERVRYYEIHVGLGTMSYQGFTGDWTSLDWTAERTLELATTW